MTSRRSALKTFFIGFLAACDSTIARLKGRRVVAVTTADKIRPDLAYRATVGEQPIIVVNDGGTTRTFVAVCTHEGCPLGWNPQQRLIRCPCHGSAFNTAGKVVNGPAPRALTELETFVERGKVLVAFPRGASLPGASSPGASSPGASSPGASSPGASSPGASSPGASSPGASSPGASSPGASS